MDSIKLELISRNRANRRKQVINSNLRTKMMFIVELTFFKSILTKFKKECLLSFQINILLPLVRALTRLVKKQVSLSTGRPWDKQI